MTNTLPHSNLPAGVLVSLGLSEHEDAAYRVALGSTVVDDEHLATHLGLTPASAAAALDGLLQRGLVVQISDGRGCAAVDPRKAVRLLVEEQTALVERARSSIAMLADTFDAARRDTEHSPTQVVVGHAAIGEQIGRLAVQVNREFCGFDKPPYVTTAEQPFEYTALARGVQWRTVYDRESVEIPGRWHKIRKDAEAGELARIASGIPVKLAIADRRMAVVSLDLSDERPEALITQSAPLVDALCQLFDTVWQRAIPVVEIVDPTAAPPAPAGAPATTPTATTRPPSADERELLALLALGIKDEGIARQLGTSLRTVRRRISALLEELGTTSRFGAGYEAARRGWL